MISSESLQTTETVKFTMDKLAGIDDIMNKVLEKFHISGIAIGIIIDTTNLSKKEVAQKIAEWITEKRTDKNI